MPRLSRAIFGAIPRHITQRGNLRENVFFTEEDRTVYLDWIKEYGGKHRVEIRAYCLMTNPIHRVAIPERRLATDVKTVAHALWAKS
jgi:putative transposase